MRNACETRGKGVIAVAAHGFCVPSGLVPINI